MACNPGVCFVVGNQAVKAGTVRSGVYNFVMATAPLVGVLMGSKSDWDVMQFVTELLQAFDVTFETRIVSAHRTPDLLAEYAKEARGRGLQVIIAGAGGAAHLPGMLAANTILPVIGVPIPATLLNGLDSLLSMVQMPQGVPVATVAIGKPGAANAALLAMQVLSLADPVLSEKLVQWRADNSRKVLAEELPR